MADSGADSRQVSRSSAAGGSAILASAVAGAIVGAAGLTWWLLSEADRRRRGRPRLRTLPSPRVTASLPVEDQESRLDHQLHDRVQQLNQAIEEVRRQLEQLQPSP